MSTNDDIRARQVERLQENLSTLRKLAGWTAEELGDKIGVTKQTISNWENYKPNDSSLKKSGAKMGLVHYIAIRHVLDYEIENFENEEQAKLLSQAIEILIDTDEEKIPESDYKNVKDTISSVATVVAGGAFGVAVSMFSTMINPIVGGLIGSSGVKWISRILRKIK